METTERLLFGKILIAEFGRLSENLDPAEIDVGEIVRRANVTRFKMKTCYEKWDRPAELKEQIDEMDSIIKKLEQMQNK